MMCVSATYPGDHLLTAVCVARECGMIPSSHRVIVAEATPTSCVSYRTLGEGSPPLSTRTLEESGMMSLYVTLYTAIPSPYRGWRQLGR